MWRVVGLCKMPRKVSESIFRKPRVPTLTGDIQLAFSDLLSAVRPMVEIGDCIPATPVSMSSEVFYLCGTRWMLLVYPFGNDEEGDVLSLRLKNLTDKIVEASYKFSLKKKLSDSGCLKFDTSEDADVPSSFTGNESRHDIFAPHGRPDDEWGIEDLILLEELYPLLVDGTLVVHLYMEVFSEVDLDAHPLTRLIQTGGEAVTESELLRLADQDLMLLKRGNNGVGVIGQVASKQDSIVSRRGAEPVAPHRGTKI